MLESNIELNEFLSTITEPTGRRGDRYNFVPHQDFFDCMMETITSRDWKIIDTILTMLPNKLTVTISFVLDLNLIRLKNLDVAYYPVWGVRASNDLENTTWFYSGVVHKSTNAVVVLTKDTKTQTRKEGFRRRGIQYEVDAAADKFLMSMKQATTRIRMQRERKWEKAEIIELFCRAAYRELVPDKVVMNAIRSMELLDFINPEKSELKIKQCFSEGLKGTSKTKRIARMIGFNRLMKAFSEWHKEKVANKGVEGWRDDDPVPRSVRVFPMPKKTPLEIGERKPDNTVPEKKEDIV